MTKGAISYANVSQGRVDLTHDGAKLIVDVSGLGDARLAQDGQGS